MRGFMVRLGRVLYGASLFVGLILFVMFIGVALEGHYGPSRILEGIFFGGVAATVSVAIGRVLRYLLAAE